MARRGIQSKMAALFVAGIVIVLAINGIVGYVAMSSSLQTELKNKLERTATRLTLSLTEPLFNYDNNTVKSVVESELGDEEVSGIIIMNKDSLTGLLGLVRSDKGLA